MGWVPVVGHVSTAPAAGGQMHRDGLATRESVNEKLIRGKVWPAARPHVGGIQQALGPKV